MLYLIHSSTSGGVYFSPYNCCTLLHLHAATDPFFISSEWCLSGGGGCHGYCHSPVDRNNLVGWLLQWWWGSFLFLLFPLYYTRFYCWPLLLHRPSHTTRFGHTPRRWWWWRLHVRTIVSRVAGALAHGLKNDTDTPELTGRRCQYWNCIPVGGQTDRYTRLSLAM